MGSGSWSENNYCSYSTSVGRCYSAATRSFTDTYTSSSQAFVAKTIDESMDPKNVMRECRDSEEHPGTIPVVLALDVTGSMG